MDKQQLLDEICNLAAKKQEIFDEMKPFERRLTITCNKLEKLKEQLSIIELEEPKSEDEQFEYFLFEDGHVTGARYTAREKFWRHFCLYQSGYYPETQQIALKIKLTYGNDESLRHHITDIKKILPYIKEHTDGYKKFPLFENTLSRYGSYSLWIKDNEYMIHGRWNADKFNTLEDALKHIQKYHWYDGKEVENNEDY